MKKSRTLLKADAIEARMVADSSKVYDQAVARVIRQHGDVLRRVKLLEEKEQYDQARALIHSSGLLESLAEAIASSGRDAAALIRTALVDVKAVMADDDG